MPGITQTEEELADAVIRILDHCAYKGYRIGQAVAGKMLYNATRPHKHGKRF